MNIQQSCRLMRSWLQDCRDYHSACQGDSAAGLPTRVIDVGSSSENARLYVTKREPVSYVALSHCWGGSNPQITTQDTLDKFQEHIPLTSESQTFLDAMEVTRALGVKYLWIDSLCIIQGDDHDWAVEAAKMADIYANATVTLSADCAPNASSGLFSNEPARAEAHQSCEIQCSNPDDNSSVTIKSRTRTYYSMHTLPHTCILGNQPSKLSTRGWTLQERVLSKRIIHFYKEELVWSCATLQRCECRLSSLDPKKTGINFLTSIKRSSDELLECWPIEVSAFTKRGLTYSTDRLAAVSGLAALIHEEVGGRYLCGHWERSMEDSLLWASDHGQYVKRPVQRIPDTPYAPSWSWASVDGPIQLMGWACAIEMKFVQGVTETRTANPYGPVSMGRVTLRGRVVPLTWDADSNPVPWFTAEHSTIEASWRSEDIMFDALAESVDSEMRKSSFALLLAGVQPTEHELSLDQTFLGMLLRTDCLIGNSIYERRGLLHDNCPRGFWDEVPVQDVTIE
ncbi:hypothetical protein BFJ70_g17053 [Fusarium oxysporum]|nr:hypothetical protein BFJ70_g17053 [Fusarium oxysporum]